MAKEVNKHSVIHNEKEDNKNVKLKSSGKRGHTHILFDADPDCDHNIQARWSGVKCTRCGGWFCY